MRSDPSSLVRTPACPPTCDASGTVLRDEDMMVKLYLCHEVGGQGNAEFELRINLWL